MTVRSAQNPVDHEIASAFIASTVPSSTRKRAATSIDPGTCRRLGNSQTGRDA